MNNVNSSDTTDTTDTLDTANTAPSQLESQPESQRRSQPERPAPQHGEHAADLIFDAQADRRRGGIWIYPACYDDFSLARRRAHSLSQGFGIPFTVDLFGAAGQYGALTPSVAIAEPGFYVFTTQDPRPQVIPLNEGRE